MYLKHLQRKTVLLASWLKKITLGKSSCYQKSLAFAIPELLGLQTTVRLLMISSRDIYYATIEVHINDSTCSRNTSMLLVSSINRALSMPQNIYFAQFSTKDTYCLHIVCSARKYSHLPNKCKAGENISTKLDFTKFYVLQDFQEAVLFI